MELDKKAKQKTLTVIQETTKLTGLLIEARSGNPVNAMLLTPAIILQKMKLDAVIHSPVE